MNVPALLHSQKDKKLDISLLTYVLGCFCFCGMYFIRDFWGVGISFYLIYAVAAVILMIATEEQAIAFFLSLTVFSGAGFNGAFCTLMLGIIAIRFIRPKTKCNAAFLCLVAICIYEFAHSFSPSLPAYGTLLTYYATVLSASLIFCYPHNKINKHLVLNSVICFSLFFAFMSVTLLTKIYGSFGELIELGFRTEEYKELTKGSSYLVGNSNFLTLICSFNICLCTLMATRSKRRWPYLLAIAFFLFVGLLTVSKMFLAVLVAYAAYLIFAAWKKHIGYGILTAVLVISVAVVLMHYLGDSLLQMLFDRFENEELTTGRIDIIERLLNFMSERPWSYLFGVGILNLQNSLGVAVHSSIFELLGGWGLFGFLLVIALVFSLMRLAKKQRAEQGIKAGLLNYLPLGILLGYSVIGMLFSSGFSIARLLIGTYALELGKEE